MGNPQCTYVIVFLAALVYVEDFKPDHAGDPIDWEGALQFLQRINTATLFTNKSSRGSEKVCCVLARM